jgi:hypothetical protein
MQNSTPPPHPNIDEQLQTNFVELSLYWEVARYTTSQRCCCLCMEPEFSFPCRQELAAGSYSEPLAFIPHSRAPFPSSRLLVNVFVPYVICLRLASDHIIFRDKYCVYVFICPTCSMCFYTISNPVNVTILLDQTYNLRHFSPSPYSSLPRLS